MDYKFLFLFALVFGSLFGGVSLIFYFGEWDRLAIVTLLGVLIGTLFAPELEPKKFKKGWLLQIVAGFIAGIIAGIFFGLSGELIFCCAIIGGFLGWIAPSWVKHVQIP